MQTNPSEKCIYCKATKTCELHHNLADMHKAIEDFQEIKLLPLIRVHSTQVSQPVVPEWEETHTMAAGECTPDARVVPVNIVHILLQFVRNATLEQAAEAVKSTQDKYYGADKRTKEPTYSGGSQCRSCMKRKDAIEIEYVITTIRQLKSK